jgi:hypothetical protein
VAKPLALDQSGGQGGAVELDQRLGRAPGIGVDGPGDQLLAGPRLAVDQHGGVGRRHPADLLQHGQQRRGTTDDLLEVMNRLDLLLEVEVLLLEARTFGLGAHPIGDVDPDRVYGLDPAVGPAPGLIHTLTHSALPSRRRISSSQPVISWPLNAARSACSARGFPAVVSAKQVSTGWPACSEAGTPSNCVAR